MENTPKTPPDEELSNVTTSFGISLAIASVVSALLVVAKEESPRLMRTMKSATGHHWSTHSVLALGIFLVVGVVLTRMNGGRGLQISPGRLVQTIICAILIGSFIIVGYYLFWD